MEARVILTKETKDKMNKGLTKRERGKLRYEKLVQVANNGHLSQAKSRIEVAKMVGFTDSQYKRGYGWVTNMLRRGHLSETLLGTSRTGKPEYEYHLGKNTPDYDFIGVRKKRSTKAQVDKPEVKKEITTPVQSSNIGKVTLKVGEGFSIEMEQIDWQITPKLIVDIVSNLVKEVK